MMKSEIRKIQAIQSDLTAMLKHRYGEAVSVSPKIKARGDLVSFRIEVPINAGDSPPRDPPEAL